MKINPGTRCILWLWLAALAAAAPSPGPALTFKDIQPGQTEKASVEKILGPGQPMGDESKKNPWFKYKLEPYADVYVQYDGKLVQRIRVDLKSGIPMPQVLDALGVTGEPESTADREHGERVDAYPRLGLDVCYRPVGGHKLVRSMLFEEPRYLKIENLWLEHGKEHPEYFGRGMILHVDFEAVGLMNEPVAIDGRFHLDDPAKGNPALRGKTPLFSDEKGQAWCGRTFTPRRKVVQYRDYQLFMPMDQLYLSKGRTELLVDLKLTAKDAAPASAKESFHSDFKVAMDDMRILKQWVEHNVMEEDLNGLRVHLDFKIFNHKDKQCRAILFIDAKNGLFPIHGYAWVNSDGEVMSRSYFTPQYAASEYNDFTLFLPYKEIRKPAAGRVDLVGHVVIRDEADNQLGDTSFEFQVE